MLIEAALLAAVVVHSRGRAAVAGSLLSERWAHYDRRDRAAAVHAARSRWLHAHGASSSFPCGFVRPLPPRPDRATPPWPFPDEVPVTAAILPSAFAFLVDPPDGYVSEDPIEAGAIPIRAVAGVQVLRNGEPVPRPASEPIEDEPACWLVLRWEGGEQLLGFRSAWLAWRTADRFESGV